MPADPDCLFCKIIAGDVPSTGVLFTDTVYAFRDVNPAAPVHVLVTPREHVESAHHLRPEHAPLVSDCVAAVQQVAEQEGIATDGYRVVLNVGRHGGMTIPHLHFHVLGGRPLRWPPE